MQIKFLLKLALFRRSHELLFIYVFGERNDIQRYQNLLQRLRMLFLNIKYVLETMKVS